MLVNGPPQPVLRKAGLHGHQLRPCSRTGCPGQRRSAGRRLREVAHPTAADILGLIELHHLLTDLLRRSWGSAQSALGECVEAGRLRPMLEPIRDGAAAQLDVLPLLRNLRGAVQAPPADLEADEEQLRALRDRATKLLDWLAAPRPPIDPARLARGIAQGERGEVVNAADVLARLRAGEEP
jgi:hypothetical protein